MIGVEGDLLLLTMTSGMGEVHRNEVWVYNWKTGKLLLV